MEVSLVSLASAHLWNHQETTNYWLRGESTAIPSPFYEAQFGDDIFVELYDSMVLSPVSSYVLKRYITFYFIELTVIVYCYYGYLPILQHI